MGFRINNNISALVAQGNLMKTASGIGKSIERLSSGLRINRGADDAAGLTISEKLRGQIRGLNRAAANAQDGISLIQTAEGALNEDASILNRLRELAIQSQADSLTTNDRLEIQKEVDQLVDEVDRISKTTEFNTKKLLDGTANALVSTNNPDLVLHQVGEAGKLSAGGYTVRVNLASAGEKQVQKSTILTDKDTGTKAGLSTKLKDVESFYDNSGNLILEQPETMTIRGNGAKVDVTISSDMTLEQLASAVESEITKSKQDGGLGITGSTFAFNAQTGQVIFESGKDGFPGEISLSSDESIIVALGMQITTLSESSAFEVTATSTGVATPISRTVNTTTDRASGVIAGLDLQFQLPSAARADGTVAGSDSIYVNVTQDVVFTIHDTNAQSNGQAKTSAGVRITLTRGRTYTNASIANIVNAGIAAANDDNHALNGGMPTSTNYNTPGITASMDGYNLVLTSSVSGSSGGISILANNAATDVLGVQTSNASGSGGEAAVLTGSTNISGGVSFTGTGVVAIQVADGDFNILGGTANPGSPEVAGSITFNAGQEISATSIVNTFNTFMNANNVKAAASMTSDGKLELRSTETGDDARISIASFNGGSLSALGVISGQADSGRGGSAAVFSGQTNESFKTIGFTMSGQMGVNITDKAGATSGTIFLGTADVNNVMTAGESHTVAKEQLVSLFNGSNLNSTDVTYNFDAGNRLDFVSRSAGETSRIVFQTSGGNADFVTTGQSAFGINFASATQGSGNNDFNVHVSDRSLKFQIGANKSQQLDFSVINTSAQSLGLNGLDITNVKAATKALGDIDRAVNMISSERSKLGSLQNRLTSTVNNLQVTSTNLQSTESKIRDVDIATETVNFTRFQILQQAGTSQLAQARQLSQGALALLQG